MVNRVFGAGWSGSAPRQDGPPGRVSVGRRLAHWLGGFLPGARARRAQVVEFEAAWARANDEAVLGAGPLLVVLGDSTAQAIGASVRDSGYALGVLAALRREDPAWRLVNLSRTGARVADVLDVQLPALARLPEPALVTVAVGANDVRHRTPGLAGAVRTLVAALPPTAVVATVPQGLRPGPTRLLNEVIRDAAAARGLRVADVWARTGPPWRGKFSTDQFHPSDAGYADWTAAFLAALGLPAPAVPATPPSRRQLRREQLQCLGRRLGLSRRRRSAP
jgi:acyl-CoA thioesterase I